MVRKVMSLLMHLNLTEAEHDRNVSAVVVGPIAQHGVYVALRLNERWKTIQPSPRQVFDRIDQGKPYERVWVNDFFEISLPC